MEIRQQVQCLMRPPLVPSVWLKMQNSSLAHRCARRGLVGSGVVGARRHALVPKATNIIRALSTGSAGDGLQCILMGWHVL